MVQDVVEKLFAQAGVQIQGDQPWDMQVHNPETYRRVLTEGSVGLGESSMDGWWTCEALDQCFERVISARLNHKIVPLSAKWVVARSRLFNVQTKLGSRRVIDRHYEISPAVFMSFLDPYNQYTCGYFKDTEDLNVAQEQKLDLICRKLQLSANDRVLDIGCGWGGFAKFAAEHYKCHVTGITISDQQLEYGKRFCEGLPVSLLKCDYRDFDQTGFDKVLVCGMIEHVGHKNYRPLMEVAHGCLADGGQFLLHTIGRHSSGSSTDPWINKYIFPNSMLPSARQLTTAAEGLYALDDWHNFGSSYDHTLMAWHSNFVKNWDTIQEEYDDRFFRMFTYYLLSCAAIFRVNKKVLWQIVLSKRRGAKAGYQSVR